MKSLFSRLFGPKSTGRHAPAAPVTRQAQSTDSYINISFLRLSDKTQASGTVSYRVGPDTRVAFGIWDGPSVSTPGFDVFEALTGARLDLEKAGYLPLIAGARGDCYPSGMARNMGEGDMVYRLQTGRTPDLDDLVFMFDPAAPETVTTVKAQAAAFDAWARTVPDTDDSDA